jgi:hypothetical protein
MRFQACASAVASDAIIAVVGAYFNARTEELAYRAPVVVLADASDGTVCFLDTPFVPCGVAMIYTLALARRTEIAGVANARRVLRSLIARTVARARHVGVAEERAKRPRVGYDNRAVP